MDHFTHLPDAEGFTRAFREGTLLSVFESLALKGPEGEFKANGLLYRKGDSAILEYVPIPADGSTMPPRKARNEESPDNCWNGSGVTIDGLKVELKSLLGFGGNFLQFGFPRRKRFQQEVETILVESQKDHARQPKEVQASFYASVADTDLLFANSGSESTTRRRFREQSTTKWSLDSLVGESERFEFEIRAEGADLAIEMVSKEGTPTLNVEQEASHLEALLDGMAILLGQNMQPWRQVHHRTSGYHRDRLRPRFSLKAGAMRPYHESRRDADEPARFIGRCIDYFAQKSETSDQLAKYLWQMRESSSGQLVTLHGVLHLCAIFEGLAGMLLRTRAGWSRTRLRKKENTAEIRFQEIARHYGLPAGGFQRAISAWKSTRNTMAHGDLFSDSLADGKIIKIQWLVSAGILALALREIGWKAVPDFDTVERHGFLFPIHFG